MSDGKTRRSRRAPRKQREQESRTTHSQPASPAAKSRLLFLLAGGGALLAAVWLVVRMWTPAVEPPDVVLQKSRAALARGDFETAEKMATWIELDSPLGPESRLIAGEAATRAGRLPAAVQHYQAIGRDGSTPSVAAAMALGEVFRTAGQLSLAVQQYTYVLEHQPAHLAAHERLAFVLDVTGQRWESVPHAMAVLRSGNSGLPELVALGDSDRQSSYGGYLQHAAENAPQDPLVQLGLASQMLANNQHSEAVAALEKVVAERPELIAAQARLGALLLDRDEQEFIRWHADLPSAAETHPEIWYVRGQWVSRRGEDRSAVRCYWEALSRAPEHRRACFQLGRVLARLDAPEAIAFDARASQLVALSQRLDDAHYAQGQDEAVTRRVMALLEQVGRLWEAWAWAQLATELHPQAPWPEAELARLRGQIREDLPRTVPAANLALDLAGTQFPLPALLLEAAPTGSDDGALAATEGGPGNEEPERTLQFVEEASAVGIDFVYQNGADPETPGARQFEQTGGGVAALDYDLDGFPDLYFTQGARWEKGAAQPRPTAEYADQLYRNLDGKSFGEVAAVAGVENLDFGQGVAAGDFNCDGFPDLYVAQIGRNRLYRNNGDGTFSDVTGSLGTDSLGTVAESWTSSCVIADLTGDGLPDLYDANYLSGPDIYQRICQGRVCSPNEFAGAHDLFLSNQGDGTFAAVAEATPEPAGKGMGVLAARLEEDSLLSLFITNDQVANSLLRLAPSSESSLPRLQDSALFRGLAFSSDGLPLACMGIAADDADGDERIDFFVTNFQNEPNSLYLQDSAGMFIDAARMAGLHAAGLPYVGWGAQFLDAELDGDADLVAVNGHVDDFRDEGGLFQMPPQFFRNAGNGRFSQLEADQVGAYFGRSYLGRGLARLDWNRDGRMDFVVSNIAGPASLVSNRSENVGHYVNVYLHGTLASRDAIGSVVQVEAEGRRWSKQLVAGDGYMATNQRMLQFGLGDISSAATVRVNWPSGRTTSVAGVPSDSTLEFVEGAEQAVLRTSTGAVRMVQASPRPAAERSQAAFEQ